MVLEIKREQSAKDHVDGEEFQRRQRKVLYTAADTLNAEPGDLDQGDCPSEPVGLVFVPDGLDVHVGIRYVVVSDQIENLLTVDRERPFPWNEQP